MKRSIYFSIFLVLITSKIYAQDWQTYDFSADGVGAKVNFPAPPTKTVAQNGNVTNYTYRSTVGTDVYMLVASTSTGVFPKGNAKQSFENSSKNLKKIQKQEAFSYQKYEAYKAQAEMNNGNFMNAQYVAHSKINIQMLIISKTNTFANSDKFFGSLLITALPADETGVKASYAVGDRVEVFYKDPVRGDSWLPAIILKVQTDGKYFVNYDAYAETYDEAVEAKNVRPMNLNIQGKVQYVPAKRGQVLSVNGNLSKGSIMEDLEWAESSANACWVGIRNVEFQGNHVFYWFDLPKKSTVKITVVPKGNKPRVNVYGFISFDFKFIPPDLPRCISCEAGFQQWVANNPPDFTKSAGEQSIEFNAISSRMKVFVGVAGAKGFTSGDYELKIEIK
ncbi:hypothetical protein AD998_06615 [bacterium 336/3]|nr:hypothetical protein AD998_06615 [bacterium 336/3]